MKKILIFFVLFICSQHLYADSIKGGFPFCLTKSLYEQITRSETDREFKYLLNNGCLIPQIGLEITVLESSVWNPIRKIRIYYLDTALTGYTHMKNINRNQAK